jgi:molecular chaperone GrpE
LPHAKHSKDENAPESSPNLQEAPAVPPQAPPQEAASSTPETPLAEQLDKLQAEKDELFRTLVRRQADFENFRKRLERESQESGQRVVARLIEDLLPTLDAFERAIAAHDDPAYEDYRKGFELIYRQLWDALERQGLARVDAEGRRFDPHIHQAVERIESEDHEDGAVIGVLQQGYTLRGRVLRPAIVRVAVHPREKTAGTDQSVN